MSELRRRLARERRRLAREEGIALVVAVMLVALMSMVGLAGFAYVDTQQSESGIQRQRESAFNLGEGVLSAQTFVVASKWPDSAALRYPDHCASTGTQTGFEDRCPDPAFVSASYSTPDYGPQTRWVVDVRDNGPDQPETAKTETSSVQFYDPADDDTVVSRAGKDSVQSATDDADDTATDAQPRWDRGGAAGYNQPDGRVWLRAQASVRGRLRTLIALVDINELSEAFPSNAVTTGTLHIVPSAAKPIINSGGRPVAIRCTDSTCANKWTPEQITGGGGVQTLVDGNKALSDRALDRLRDRARAAGTYYAGTCPDRAQWEAPVVFIENGPCDMSPDSDGTFNSPAGTTPGPGLVVVASGTLAVKGNVNFHGVIYMANRTNLTSTVLDINGSSSVLGSVAIDGPGRLEIGSSGQSGSNLSNVVYDPSAVGAVKTYPSGAIVPSTWREIPSG